ncbi:MAG: xylosidase/arabinosidase [Akkermansiaceae bacterium]|nr:xylosidase/arabinosidase [Akkermansiaceae bacterium]MCF7732202.1 xylosidase/arabinosidase [Akkermansiaceae bacterium]
MNKVPTLLLLGLIGLLAGGGLAAVADTPLKPYTGPSVRGVDPGTLAGKLMAGYQGWFNCEGDGAGLGWTHWARHGGKSFGPGNVTVDLWPDLSELSPPERFATGFKLADGSTAEVFSSHNRQTVLRHFRWMREYGIDGVFVQRFANGLRGGPQRLHKDIVLANCREGANREGRTYAVMYDLSGLPAGGTAQVIADWNLLHTEMRMGDDPAYLHHHGKPLVAVWGIGFSDGRHYTLAECAKLVNALKADGCAVMLGVPTSWRELNRDAVGDPALHELVKLADVVSPWTPGRYVDPAGVARHSEHFWKPDLAWCRSEAIDYLPVVFPGFSWHNMNPRAKLDQIPRLKGGFLWSQLVAAKRAGAGMIYVAMFDEVDEGTAIFKCTNKPPTGADPFLTYEGLPSDHYLWLTGEGGRMLRGERPPSDTPPTRAP